MTPDSARPGPCPSLTDVGYAPYFSAQLDLLGGEGLVPARIAADGSGLYSLLGCAAAQGELTGKLRQKLSPAERPVAGDWVAVDPSHDPATIHHVLDRRTVLRRRAAGRAAATQIIAANVDVFFVVTSADRDLNPRRVERYVAAVLDGGANPVIVVNKTDLVADPSSLVEELGVAAATTPVVCVSAQAGTDLDALREHIGQGTTVGLVGSSGVGKSTLVNRLLGRAALPTTATRSDGKGRHTTTRRQLLVLPTGGILIDTPGMRELGLAEDEGGLDAAFPELSAIAERCRFGDCGHSGEPGCAVLAAVEAGEVDRARLDSYRQLQREIAVAEARRDPAVAGNVKRRWKTISKAIRALEREERQRRR